MPDDVSRAAAQIVELRAQLEQVGADLTLTTDPEVITPARLERARLTDALDSCRRVIYDHERELGRQQQKVFAQARQASDQFTDEDWAALQRLDHRIGRQVLAAESARFSAEGALTPRVRAHREALLAQVRHLSLQFPGIQFARLHWVIPTDGEGGRTVPACTCWRGIACGSPGNHPLDEDWPRQATGVLDVIDGWWGPWDGGMPTTERRDFTDGEVQYRRVVPASTPLANLAAACEQVLALDVDPRNGGTQTLARLEAKYGPLPRSVRGGTPRGGLHVLFPHPGGRLKSGLGPGVEVKWTGGHIITIPPSVGAHGPYAEMDGEPEELPRAWVEALTRPARPEPSPGAPLTAPANGGSRVVRYLLASIRDATEEFAARTAERHAGLFRLGLVCGSLTAALEAAGIELSAGVSEDHVLDLAHAACDRNGYLAKVGPGEIDRTFSDGYAAGRAHPRDLPAGVLGTLPRHARNPGLRVPEPPELAQHADRVFREQISAITNAVTEARASASDAGWDPREWLDLVRPVSEVLGGLGDLDLIADMSAWRAIAEAASPQDHLDAATEGLDKKQAEAFRAGVRREIARRFKEGWNEGALAGHEVPAELLPTLEAWHPRCPIPRDQIEPHRLPPGRDGCWPVRNFVHNSDDRGNAARLADHFGARILFLNGATGLGACAFDGRRWLEPRTGGPGLADELADRMIGALPVTEMLSLSVAVELDMDSGEPVSSGDRDKFLKWLAAQQSTSRRSALLATARANPRLRVNRSAFDADPRWLNTPAGEIDLGAGRANDDGTWEATSPVVFTGRHFPEHRHMRMTGAVYDPSATCPVWELALKEWLGDDDLITFTGKLVAASVRALVTLKVLACLLGAGNSGKTTFLEVIRNVLGDYATTAQPTILRKGTGKSTLSDDLDDLRGFRFVMTTETSGAEQMDEPRVKRLSGGDQVRSRGLYQSSGAWDPKFMLWLATNDMPRMSGADMALWNRLRPILFPSEFTADGRDRNGDRCKRADPGMKDRLLLEGPGILNWILRHLELLYCKGLDEPASVTVLRAELRGSQDTVGMFLAEAGYPCTSEAPGANRGLSVECKPGTKIRFTQLLRHYTSWARGAGIEHPVGKDGLRAGLAAAKIKITNPGNVVTVHGLGHPASAAFLDHRGACAICGTGG